MTELLVGEPGHDPDHDELVAAAPTIVNAIRTRRQFDPDKTELMLVHRDASPRVRAKLCGDGLGEVLDDGTRIEFLAASVIETNVQATRGELRVFIVTKRAMRCVLLDPHTDADAEAMGRALLGRAAK